MCPGEESGLGGEAAVCAKKLIERWHSTIGGRRLRLLREFGGRRLAPHLGRGWRDFRWAAMQRGWLGVDLVGEGVVALGSGAMPPTRGVPVDHPAGFVR